MMFSWCLLVTALTLSGITTPIRIELLEIRFRVFFVDAYPADPLPGTKDVPAWLVYLPRRVKAQSQFLYTNGQIRDTLNPCIALITIVSDAKVPFSLNRLGARFREWTDSMQGREHGDAVDQRTRE